MNLNGTADYTRASVRQRLLSVSRSKLLAITLVLLLIFVAGVGVASSFTIPTMSITDVVADQSVSIMTYNFPANQDFVVTMGPMGSRGLDGYYVTTVNSGAGGSFPATFTIPDQLKGSYQIAIRLQSPQGYYSFNWFYNNTTGFGGGTGGSGGGDGAVTLPEYTGTPVFKVCSVVKDQKVHIRTYDFPPNQQFTVTMGLMGTAGINGIVVGQLDSGTGGTLDAEFSIPAELYGQHRISIRTQSGHAYPYYAYNWFYNNTANVCP